jgi:hypothetical protein
MAGLLGERGEGHGPGMARATCMDSPGWGQSLGITAHADQTTSVGTVHVLGRWGESGEGPRARELRIALVFCTPRACLCVWGGRESSAGNPERCRIAPHAQAHHAHRGQQGGSCAAHASVHSVKGITTQARALLPRGHALARHQPSIARTSLPTPCLCGGSSPLVRCACGRAVRPPSAPQHPGKQTSPPRLP